MEMKRFFKKLFMKIFQSILTATTAVTRDQSHLKNHPIQLPPATHEGMWRIYSKPDPHWDVDMDK
jgi:hypothetical protein